MAVHVRAQLRAASLLAAGTRRTPTAALKRADPDAGTDGQVDPAATATISPTTSWPVLAI